MDEENQRSTAARPGTRTTRRADQQSQRSLSEGKDRGHTVTRRLIVFSIVCALSAAPPPDSVFTLMICPAGDQRPRNSEGDIVKLKNGRLLLAYSEFVGADGSDFGAARLGAKTSRDGGHSWSLPYVLVP